MTVDDVDEVLVGPFVSGDETEVISISEGNVPFFLPESIQTFVPQA